MVKEIFWTKTAKTSVKLIFDYYKKNVSETVAQRIKSKIFNKVKILTTQPKIGAKEELLSSFDIEYKYLISENYKIIYFISDNMVIISLVFDTRQNPQKLKNIIEVKT